MIGRPCKIDRKFQPLTNQPRRRYQDTQQTRTASTAHGMLLEEREGCWCNCMSTYIINVSQLCDISQRR